MSKSQRLSETQIRAGFRLIGEACELGHDWRLWRPHLVGGLCGLVGASRGFAGEEQVSPHFGQSQAAGFVVYGYDDVSPGLARYEAEGGIHIHPYFPTIQPVAARPWTRTRRELFPDDRAWYADRVVAEFCRSDDLDDNIHSRQPVPRPGWSSMIAVFRAWDERPFAARERRLVHLVHEELGRLWRRPPPPDPADVLPARQRQVVERFRLGDSEKQVAYRLGLSRQTVHAYAKDLHKRFSVSSRIELLARLAPPVAHYRPRLATDAAR